MRNQKGITLVSLIITIIVLSILASIATYSGVNVIQSSKFTAFTTELKIMQTQVNAIYEQRQETKLYGEEITGEIKTRADIVFTERESGITSQEGYRYWNIETIKSLGIEGVKQSFFVNLEKRSIVSYEGFRYEKETYYTLEQLPDGLYNIEYEPNTNKPTFDVNIEQIGTDKWKITVSNVQYDGYINKWQIRYRAENKSYWNTTEDMSFIVEQMGNYKIQLINSDIMSDEKVVLVIGEYEKSGLQLYYDGINNTRNGNNPNATSWEDLSDNQNDGIFYNINTESSTTTSTLAGYYSQEEKGYVFLHNKSYVKSTNKIGIAGDPNYTIEVISNSWMGVEEKRDPIYSSTYNWIQAAWFGGNTAEVGNACVFGFRKINSNSIQMFADFVNHATKSDKNYEITNKPFYLSFRKTKVGEIKTGDTDIGKMNYNGQDVPNTYKGTATFTPNIIDSEVQVGRSWQWNNENRTFYGSVQAVRIYNRVLTDEELQRNYEIDKIRFNLDT